MEATPSLADKSPDGKGLNAPNDGCAHPDGWYFITDPGYGALMNYEGERLKATTPQPIQKEAVYRIDGPGMIEKVADEPFKPNGICFSPDFKKVYIADTGASHYPDAKRIICDEDGNVWAAMGWVGDGYDGVHVFSPDGTRIGQIRMPEIISNVAFGGTKRNRLFMTGSTSLYAVYVETRGANIGG